MSQVAPVLASLRKLGSRRVRDGMARYAIVAPKSFGVSMGAIRKLAKQIGRDHKLAVDLWESGWYEARLLVAFVADPARLAPAQMDRWCRQFDNWAVCDTLCFHLFDRTPYAFGRVARWSPRRDEFVRRAAFALLASLALHADGESDAAFLRCLPLVERTAADERNFVKKGVSWALRAIGGRSPKLHESAVALARRLAASESASERWVGKDALRDLTRPLVARRIERSRRS